MPRSSSGARRSGRTTAARDRHRHAHLHRLRHLRHLQRRCAASAQAASARSRRRGGYAGPIFIPSGGSWSSGSSGGGCPAADFRAAAARSAAAARRGAGRCNSPTPTAPASSRRSAQAETRTSGEIYCVITRASSGYRVLPLAWAAVVALLMPLPLIQLTTWPAVVIYALQLSVFLVALYGLTRDAHPLPARAAPNQARARASARRCASSPRTASAHRAAHRRVDFRLGRRALCRSDRRCRHRPEGVAATSGTMPWRRCIRAIAAGRRPTASSPRSRNAPSAGRAFPARRDQPRRTAQRDRRALILRRVAIASFVRIAIGWPL